MDQARYWMWAKKNPDPNPRDHIPYGDSWEELAFAEDAAGGLGGCVWPPRSYSCSFCRREFRSAQALGGHMNVHRRDRARLKESPIRSPEVVLVPQDPAPFNTCTSQTCTFLYSHNHHSPNPEFPETRVSSPPPAPAAAVKVIKGDHENTTTLSFLPHKNGVVSWEQLPSWSSFVAEKRDKALGSNKNQNPVACRKKMTITSSDDGDDVVSSKRRRIEEKPSCVFPKLRAVDRCVSQSEVAKLCPGPVEELDLELRLGHSPKVK